MKTLDEYHGMKEEGISFTFYFLVFLVSVLIFSMILSLKIDFNLMISLVKKEDGYEAYLSNSGITQIPSQGILLVGKSQYHYTLALNEEAELAYQNETFYLVKFQIKEQVDQKILSGRIRISRNTIFEKIFSLWKEEA